MCVLQIRDLSLKRDLDNLKEKLDVSLTVAEHFPLVRSIIVFTIYIYTHPIKDIVYICGRLYQNVRNITNPFTDDGFSKAFSSNFFQQRERAKSDKARLF